ncbi:hypothetical protein DIPPA_24327 [Diplonema papillatum]|nr:hypothetical protein DIPPA_24327 [Diplonema papillatum]
MHRPPASSPRLGRGWSTLPENAHVAGVINNAKSVMTGQRSVASASVASRSDLDLSDDVQAEMARVRSSHRATSGYSYHRNHSETSSLQDELTRVKRASAQKTAISPITEALICDPPSTKRGVSTYSGLNATPPPYLIPPSPATPIPRTTGFDDSQIVTPLFPAGHNSVQAIQREEPYASARPLEKRPSQLRNSEEPDTVGQLQLAISSRDSRMHRMLAEQESIISEQRFEIERLQSKIEEMKELHAGQMASVESKAAQLQIQVQRALVQDARMSPKKSGVEMETMYRTAALKAEKSDEDVTRLTESLKRANELLHVTQDDVMQERMVNSKLVSETRMELRRELEEAHVEIIENERLRFEKELKEQAQNAQRNIDKLVEELNALRSEYVTVETDRETARRELQAKEAELSQHHSQLQLMPPVDFEEVDMLKAQHDKDTRVITDLKAVNRRLQTREGTLEARIVELELAAGLAQEEAAGEERMKAAQELHEMQVRHRNQTKRDAEELGRLRGMLSATEAKLELSEEVVNSLETKLSSAQRYMSEMQTEASSIASQKDVRDLELDQFASKVQLLEKNLTENRALLGRQAGQLQASQDRASVLEVKLREMDDKVDEAEREVSSLTAENAESKATIESQAADLQKSRQEMERKNLDKEDLLRKIVELNSVAQHAAQHVESTKMQLEQSEDRCIGLQAALAQQASSLRSQLQIDLESAFAMKLTRERTESERIHAELEQQLHIACRRRRAQAKKAADALQKSTTMNRLAFVFTNMRVYSADCSLQRTKLSREQLGDELDATKRREIGLLEELDVACFEGTQRVSTARHRKEHVRNVLIRATGTYFLRSILMRWLVFSLRRRQQKAMKALTDSHESVTKRSSLVAKSRALALAASRLRSVEAESTSTVAFWKWKAACLFARLDGLETECRSWAKAAGRGEKKKDKAALLRLAERLRLRGVRHACYLRWQCWVVARQLHSVHALNKELPVQRTIQLADLMYKRRRSMVMSSCFGAWLRWICYLKVNAGVKRVKVIAAEAKQKEAEFNGEKLELELNLDQMTSDIATVTEKYEESLEMVRGLQDKAQMLERGLTRARAALVDQTEENAARVVDLERERDELRGEARELSLKVSRYNEQTAANSAAATQQSDESEILNSEITAMQAALHNAEEDRARQEKHALALREEISDLSRQLAESEMEVVSSHEATRELRVKHEKQLSDAVKRAASLELVLKEAEGEIRSLEKELEGRTSDQYRLGNDLDTATLSLSQESERRKALERALAEVQTSSDKHTAELAEQVTSLERQLTELTADNRSLLKRNDEVELDLAEMKGRIAQVDKMRAKLGGATSDYSKALDQSGKSFQHEDDLIIMATRVQEQEAELEELTKLLHKRSVEVEELQKAHGSNLHDERSVQNMLEETTKRLTEQNEVDIANVRKQYEERQKFMQEKLAAQAVRIVELEKCTYDADADQEARARDNKSFEFLSRAQTDEITGLHNRNRALQIEVDTINDEYDRRGADIKLLEKELAHLKASLRQRETGGSPLPTQGEPPVAEIVAFTQSMPESSRPVTTSIADERALQEVLEGINEEEDGEESRDVFQEVQSHSSSVIDLPQVALDDSPRVSGVSKSPDPPRYASPSVETLQAVPPASPPSPFGRSERVAVPNNPSHVAIPELTSIEKERVAWIFEYGDADGDGYLSYEELRRLATDTSGGLDKEQYLAILEVLNATEAGLQIEHLEKLYLELGSPGDIDDNYEALQRLNAKRQRGSVDGKPAVVPPPAIQAQAPQKRGSRQVSPSKQTDSKARTSPSREPSPKKSRLPPKDRDLSPSPQRPLVRRHSSASPVAAPAERSPCLSPHHKADDPKDEALPLSPALSSLSARAKLTSASYSYGKTGSLPFKVTMPSKQDPDPIVTVSSTQIKNLAKGILIIEVTNQTTLTSTRIATRDQFLQATSPQNGVFDGTELVFKVVADLETIKKWKAAHKSEYGKKTPAPKKGALRTSAKKVYPHVPKMLVEDVSIVVGALSPEARDARVKRLADKLSLHPLVDKDAVDLVKVFLLVHDPEQLRREVMENQGIGLDESGFDCLERILSGLNNVTGFPAPPLNVVADIASPHDDFMELWHVARKSMIRAYDGELGASGSPL